MLKYLLLLFPLFLYSDQLKENFSRGQVGEFVIAQHQKNYTLWHIKAKQGHHLLLEEITVPMKRVKEGDWQGWVDRGAPSHVGWIMYTIDLQKGKVTGIYSLDQDCWYSEELANRFLATLLNIQFFKVEEQDRRKLANGSYWNPPLYYQGQEQSGYFDEYVTRWPADGSELSNKKVDIYLLQSDHHPSFFPYWMQLSGGLGRFALRIVDSGSQLSTPTRPMWKLSTGFN